MSFTVWATVALHNGVWENVQLDSASLFVLPISPSSGLSPLSFLAWVPKMTLKSFKTVCFTICSSETVVCTSHFQHSPYSCFVIFFFKSGGAPLWNGLKNEGKSVFHCSSHWWNVSSSSSIIQAVFIGELPVAPGEICILIYLSYILYISKFFIPLQWLHASFMGSSAVFAGQIQTHFTRYAAAAAAVRLFHLGCVGWMQNL